ncbi:unnamed protein product [Merluccius merluccius]
MLAVDPCDFEQTAVIDETPLLAQLPTKTLAMAWFLLSLQRFSIESSVYTVIRMLHYAGLNIECSKHSLNH